MEEIKINQCIDFLNIALETLEANGSDAVAVEFIEDVAGDLPDEEWTEDLEGAIEYIEEGDRNAATSAVSTVSGELSAELEE